MPTERVLADFEGAWKIERVITPEVGASARFSGSATWTAQSDDLAYAEVGTLYIDGAAPMQAERRYLWTPGLHVYFDDGRFFHTVPAAGGEASHWCDPDSYHVSYDFSDWPDFRATWTVEGPRKSYVMTNHFRPTGR